MNADDFVVRTPTHHCPGCGGRLNAHGDPQRRHLAEPGDLTVCIHCAAILRLDDTLTPRATTPEEIHALPIEQKRAIAVALRAVVDFAFANLGRRRPPAPATRRNT